LTLLLLGFLFLGEDWVRVTLLTSCCPASSSQELLLCCLLIRFWLVLFRISIIVVIDRRNRAMLVLIRSGLKKLVITVVQVRFCKTLRFLYTAQIIIVLIESRISSLRGCRSRPRLFLFALFEILNIVIVFFSGYSYGIRFLRFSFEKLLFPAFIIIPSLTLRVRVRHYSGGVLSHFP
jgi:hypothetical protein